MMKGAAVIFLGVLVVVALAATPGQAISCGDIQGSLTSCVSYLTGSGEPTSECCSGVQSVAGSIQSTQDRQMACNCLKSAAGSYGVDLNAASNLPGKCGVSVGYSISPNTDCNQIS